MIRWLPLTFSIAACSDYAVFQPDPPPPADPPGDELDAQGEAPSDWVNCGSGHFALYYNLPANHPDVASEDPLPGTEPVDPDAVGFWDDEWLAYSKYDTTLEFGANWWPVDEGLADDPRLFATQWTSWLRVFDDGAPVQIVLAAETDAFVYVNDELVVARTDVRFDPETISVPLNTGVYALKVRYAQRKGDQGGFRFRVVNPADDVKVCWPDFPEEEAPSDED